MLKDLIKVSNRLDSLGLTKEADYLDSVIKKLSGSNPSQAELEGLDADRNVSANYSKGELKLLKALESVIDAFGEVLNQSFYSDELEGLYKQTQALQYEVTEKVNQASFERSMESSSPEVERMDREVGLNPTWYEDYDNVGPRPRKPAYGV
jgi:hypothetical protein